MLEESELDAWSGNFNAVPDAGEEIAQSKLPRHQSVPMICRLEVLSISRKRRNVCSSTDAFFAKSAVI